MAKQGYDPTDPSAEALGALIYTGVGTGTGWGWHGVRVPIAASVGTVSWTNTEPFPLMGRAYVYFSTAGTGTFDMGVGTAGTSAANLIDGGTMDNSDGTFLHKTPDASATLGQCGDMVFIGGSGSATSSVVLVHGETNTSTAVGVIFLDLCPI